ncbi:MAG: HAMP domain-containing histidine kinase [bacterium]|nr:HAMP domain-containing histidine kinase [bacterium]
MAESDSAQPRRLVTLRLRLTLWVVVIASVVQLTIGLVSLLFQTSAIRALYDDQLKLFATEVIDSLPLNPADVDADRLHQLAERGSLQVFFDHVRIAVFDLEGNPVAIDPLRPPPESPVAVKRAAKHGNGAFADWAAAPNGNSRRSEFSNRTYAIPIVAGNAAPPGLILWMATSDQYASQRIGSVRRAVALTTIAGMLGTAIGGWFIAGIAVRPLDRLRSAVRGLSPKHMTLDSNGEGNDPEVMQLREELDAAMARIETGYKAYGRFIANVSHELKTPIAVALTESQVLLNDKTLDRKSAVFAESIAEEMSRLGRLIESFLTLTRVREGRLETSLRDYPVNELVMDSIEHCAAFASHQGFRLRPTLLESDRDVNVCVDPDLMRTAIDNLIRNAVRFTQRDGAIEISVSIDDGGAHAVFSVRDYGPGIPEDLLPKLFDRFAQSESEARAGRGAGLGLEIAQGIAEIHDGSIAVENLEEGCMFRLRIPIASASDECDAPDASRT